MKIDWDKVWTDGTIVNLTPYNQTQIRPHKCPVCDGEGRKEKETKDLFITCHSCDGKGIVWG